MIKDETNAEHLNLFYFLKQGLLV